MIANSIAELAKITECAGNESGANDSPSPSGKIRIKLSDTCKDLLEDFSSLKLQYKLKDNWLELEEDTVSPFNTDLSTIFMKPDGLRKDI